MRDKSNTTYQFLRIMILKFNPEGRPNQCYGQYQSSSKNVGFTWMTPPVQLSSVYAAYYNLSSSLKIVVGRWEKRVNQILKPCFFSYWHQLIADLINCSINFNHPLVPFSPTKLISKKMNTHIKSDDYFQHQGLLYCKLFCEQFTIIETWCPNVIFFY